MLNLFSCPWCEKSDMLAVSYSHYFYEVHCNRCLKAVSGDGTRASAIAAWNALPRTIQAAPSDRESRLEDLAAYVGSDHILGQLTRIFGSNQRELVELRRLLAALASTTTDKVQS